jgi:hypothetical protein
MVVCEIADRPATPTAPPADPNVLRNKAAALLQGLLMAKAAEVEATHAESDASTSTQVHHPIAMFNFLFLFGRSYTFIN